MEKHMELLFHNNQRLKKIAINFLIHVKQRYRSNNPYRSSEWKKYCDENKIPYHNFYTVVRRLRRCGLIVKEGGHHDGYYRLGVSESLCKILEKEWLEFLS